MLFLAAQSDRDAGAAAAALLAGMGLVGILVIFGSLVLGLVINWLIVSKAGYSGALSLLAFVPFVNLICLLVFAFSKWPIQRELELARAANPWPGQPGPPDPQSTAIQLPGRPL